MVRNRKRETEIGKWSQETMEAALKAVNDGRKQREVARTFEIPLSTLRDRLKSGKSDIPQLGRKPTFTKEQEDEIKNHILLMAKMFYGVSRLELRKVVFEYAEVNEIKNDFDKSSKMAGVDWLQGFLRRNPELSLRKPEPTSISRITAFNEEEVKQFFSNLETVMGKFKFEGARIYNMDETGISTVQKPGRIIGPKGQKQVGAVTSWERGKNITVCCAMSASGTFIPPMFIFPRARMNPVLGRGGPEGSIYHCTTNGWINEDLFLVWLKHFTKFAKPSVEDPILLIIDNHGSHTSLVAYNFCKENGIVVVTIPPHTSHRLQPLDVTFYSGLKTAFNRECDTHMRLHLYEKITPYDVASLFNKAFMRMATVEKGVSGFTQTGIYPLDAIHTSVVDFAPAQIVPTVEMENDEDVNGETEPSRANGNPPERSESINAHKPSTSHTEISTISPLPVQSCKTRVSKRRQHSVIFTATPTKAGLIEAQEKKRKRTEKVKNSQKNDHRKKGVKTTCRRNLSLDSSTDEESDNLKLSDDESDIDWIPKGADASTNAEKNSSDVCLLCGEFGRDNELWYRCVMCSGWIHSECSGAETAKNFKCDFCKLKK